MIAGLFTKALQGDLFETFLEVIMGWKHIDTLDIGPSSTKDRVGNVVNIRSIKEVIESSVETEGKDTKKNFIRGYHHRIRDGMM